MWSKKKKKDVGETQSAVTFPFCGPIPTNVPVVHGSYVRSQPAVGRRDGPHHLLVQLVQLHGEVGEAVHLQTDERRTHTHINPVAVGIHSSESSSSHTCAELGGLGVILHSS